MWKILVFTVCISGGLAQLDLIFEWKELDYKFSSAAIREMMIKDGIFVPKNNVPARMEVYRDRLFVTIPRRREGVPVSLAFVDLADRTTKSPKFIPYPTWGAHYRDFYNEPQIADAENIAVDRCDRFWVLDNGTNPTLIAYDLKTDKILRRFTVPADQVYAYLNVMAVEDADCENTYSYIVDKYESNQMVVYSWAKNDSWLIILDKNIESLAMAPNNTLYITTKWTYELFSISTEYFRNESIAQQSMNAFTFLGSLGSETRLGTMVFDSQTGVLFYLAGNGSNVEHGQYELACWNTIKEHNVTASGSITVKDHTMFPLNDIKIDNQNLWVLSLRVPWSWKNQTDVNFRLFSASVLEAINNNFCDIPNSTINSTITSTTIIAQKSSDT